MILFVLLINVDAEESTTVNSGSEHHDSLSSASTKKARLSSKISLININEDDWEQILDGEWMVEL